MCGRPGLPDGHFRGVAALNAGYRVTVGLPEEMRAFREAFVAVLKGAAALAGLAPLERRVVSWRNPPDPPRREAASGKR